MIQGVHKALTSYHIFSLQLTGFTGLIEDTALYAGESCAIDVLTILLKYIIIVATTE